MRSFALYVFTLLLTVRQLVRVLASPIHELAAIGHLQENTKFEERATNLFVPLNQVGLNNPTYIGTLDTSSLFPNPFTKQEVRDIAQKTFEEWDKRHGTYQPSLLVAVIAIPGHGLAAGTIWHGNDENFALRAQQEAPKLWALLQHQNLRPGMTASKWHAEVVASWVAESHFPGVKETYRWPENTLIAVYGRYTIEDGGNKIKVVRSKPVCAPGSSSNTIPCTRILIGQNIGIAS